MGNFKKIFTILSISTFISLAGLMTLAPSGALAADETTNEELLERIEVLEGALAALPALQEELKSLRQLLEQNSQATQQAKDRAAAAEVKADQATKTAQTAIEEIGRDGPMPDSMWHLAGYADAGAMFQTNGGDDTFAFGHFNPMFHFQYKDIVMFEGEMEFEIADDGSTEVFLEYAQLDFFLHDNLTLVVGKFLSPIGQFQERLHPTWINKIGYAPIGFGHDGAQPEAEVGIMVRGGVMVGKKSMINYALMVGNGPRLGHEGNAEFEGFGRDDNQNKAFGGRLGFLPVPYLELGVSYLKGKLNGSHGDEEAGHDAFIESIILEDLEPTSANVKVWGADAAYTRGPWDFRFEYLKSVRDPLNSFSDEEGEVVAMSALTLKAWYIQLAYRLSEITSNKFLQKFEPVVRYGRFNVMGNEELEEENAQKRLNLGLNYWIAPSLVARMGYERRKFLHDGRLEELFLFQAAYGF